MDAETSIVSESASTTSRSKKIATSTWSHTRQPFPYEPERNKSSLAILYCKHCPQDNTYSSAITTNFRIHLSNKHSIIAEKRQNAVLATSLEDFDQLCNRLSKAGQVQEFNTKVLVDEALVSLIVVRDLPFRLAEWPEFHTFCRTINPSTADYLTTSHNTIASLIDTSWQFHKDLIRKKLQSAISSIHLSLNIWTSPNRHLLLGICAHFIDQPDEQLRKALIALRPVANHTGEEQCAVLLSVLQDYGIVRKVGCIIGDNATTNNTLCRLLGSHFGGEEDLVWDNEQRRLRCMGHIINLAVQAFLFQGVVEMEDLKSYDEQEMEGSEEILDRRQQFRLLGPLGKLHNIVVYIRNSAHRTKVFRDVAGQLVPLDNRTRWKSWYYMLNVATEQHIANSIDGFSKDHFDDLHEDFLLPDDWTRLRTIKSFLQPFARATLETQGDSATLDRTLFTMDVLIQWFTKSLKTHTKDPQLASRIRKGWDIFDKYYAKTELSPYYTAAIILHPRRRTKYIIAHWEKAWQQTAFKQVQDLWITYRDNYKHLDSYDKLSFHYDENQELDEFDLAARDLGRYLRPQSQDEYEDYIAGDLYDIGKMSALQWWCRETQRKRWPKLSLMAMDILSIPAMSDEPERVFSGARRTVSWDRANLSPEMLEKVECLKHWKQSRITNELYDIDS